MNRFPRKIRLTESRRIRDIIQTGRKTVTPYFVLFMKPAEMPGCAVVASRKLGGAVMRNRAKRLGREALRQVRAEDTPFDVVLVMRWRSKTVSADLVVQAYAKALKAEDHVLERA